MSYLRVVSTQLLKKNILFSAAARVSDLG
jgi:hypothetical protein